jgi:hypothetical protein
MPPTSPNRPSRGKPQGQQGQPQKASAPIDVSNLKLGKKPARPGAFKMEYHRYAPLAQLPTPPADFGHYGLVDPGWGMLMNDQLGCCVVSGSEHETMMWFKEAGRTVVFDDKSTIVNYALMGHYDGTPQSDNGCDMEYAARMRRRHGIVDASGKYHKTVAYTSVRYNNLAELAVTTFLYGATGLGVIITQAQMDQFAAGQPWDYVANSNELGGHYVPIVGRKDGLFYVVTWGKLHPVQPRFIVEQADEAVVSFSEEMMIKNVSLEGFNDKLLIGDLHAVTA